MAARRPAPVQVVARGQAARVISWAHQIIQPDGSTTTTDLGILQNLLKSIIPFDELYTLKSSVCIPVVQGIQVSGKKRQPRLFRTSYHTRCPIRREL